jgi:hypothetical protein
VAAQLLVAIALLSVLFAFSSSSASAVKPWWHLAVSSRPSSLKAGVARDEVQEITVAPGAVFELKVHGTSVGAFENEPYPFGELPHATAANVQTALESESAYGSGNVEVKGQGPEGLPPLTVTTVNADANQSVPPVEIGFQFPLGTVKAEVVTQGRPDGQIVLVATDLGDASIDGTAQPVTIADSLPPGLEAVAIEGRAGGLPVDESGRPVSCTTSSVSCAFNAALHPYEPIEVRIQVKVRHSASSSSSEEVTATVSGGGASTVSGAERLTFGGGPAFGVQGFEMTPEEEGGAIDTQAGSHPFQLTTTLNLNQTGEEEPVAMAKDLNFKLPPGLIGNPTPLPRCTIGQFLGRIPPGSEDACRPETAVGIAMVSFKLAGHVEIITTPLFNLEPEPGEPARFGFITATAAVTLDTSVRTGGDYGVTVTIRNINQIVGFISSQVTFWGVPGDQRHDNIRGWKCVVATREGQTCQGQEQLHPPSFLSMPTSCTGPLHSEVEADSWLRPGAFQSFGLTEPQPTPMPALDGCNRLPFSASISVSPDGEAGSTPTGLTIDVHVPQQEALNADGLAPSDVKDTTFVLPPGIALNPASADGLLACSEAQIALSSPEASACPEGSKVGTVEISVPFLTKPLVGSAYVAAQEANPFGSLVALYVFVEEPISGVRVKLAGEVKPDPVTGQLVSTFLNTPQGPFEDFKLHFFGGNRAPLATPALCGAYTSTASITPWSGNPAARASSTFPITSGPNGRPCQNPPPFAPSLTAGSLNIQAGAFSPFTMTMSREDGQQNLKTLVLHMPPGLSGLLTGVKLCGEAQADAGTCGSESLIGETIVSVGVGGNPYSVRGGKVYITGPYQGAPFGLSVVVRAKAGPYDLGQVVVRGKIEVDPVTAALTVSTDSSGPYKIPSILDGIPLEIQHVNFITTRPGFTFNPTNCAHQAITGTLNSIEGATQTLSVPYQATNCATLKFAPKFAVSTSGKTSKANGASLKVKLAYPKAPFGSQANIRSVKVDLPKQLPSRLTTLQKACTAAQFKANPAGCPAASLVGHARATTPLIPVPLEGPAYFVSNGGEAFPNLIIVLQGYGVTVDLVGDTFISKKGITSSTFKTVPDAPVGSFELTLPQGRFSALTANGSLCKNRSKLTMPTAFTAQNGATIHKVTKIAVTGCPKVKKAKKKGAKRSSSSHRHGRRGTGKK